MKPWEEYQTQSGPWDEYKTEAKPSVLESAGQAAAQGFSLGWGDELSPLVEKGIAKLGMSSEGYKNVYGNKSYKDLRDEYRKDSEEAKKAHPLVYGATEMITSMPALIATAGKATVPAKLAAIGGVQGGVMSAGVSEGTGWDLVKDTAVGGGIGTVLGYGGGKLGQLMKPKVNPNAVIADEKLAQEAIEKQAAKTAVSEVPELIEKAGVETPSLIKPEPKPTITPQDTLLSKLGQKDVNVVAYGRVRGGERILQEAPSLDSNVANNLRSRFDEAFEKVGNKIDDYETQAGNLIEKSNLEMSNSELASMIQNSMNDIRNSGKYASEAGKAAYRTLKKKLASFTTKPKDGTLIPKDGSRSAKWLREYIQGLREENKAFFSKVASGNEYSSAQEVVQDLTKSIDNNLKTKIPGYKNVMASYSKDLRAYMGVKKSMARQTVADFFTNKIKKPAQDILFGTRAPDEKWVGILKDFGDAAGEDILGQAKDRLAYAHLFPTKVSTAEMPTVTQEAASFAHALMKAPISPKMSAIELARASAAPIKRSMFEKGLESTLKPETKKTLYLRLAEKAQKMKAGITNIRSGTAKVLESPWTKGAGMAATMEIVKPDKEISKTSAVQKFNQQYAPMLKGAIKRGGGHSLAVTNYLLQQKDSNYRKLLNDVYENQE